MPEFQHARGLTRKAGLPLLIMKHNPTTALLLVCALLFTGCASTRQNNASMDTIDPNEETNRKFYNFTDMVDRNVLAPVADVYIKYVPDPCSVQLEISMTTLHIRTLS